MADLEGQASNPGAEIFNEMQQVAEGAPAVEEEVPPVVEAAVAPVEGEAAAEEAPKYRIAGKDFATQEEAFTYAEEIDRDNAIKEAELNAHRQISYNQQQLQQQTQNVTPVAETDEEFDAKFYENPKKFLAEREERIRQQTRDEVLSTVGQQNEEEKLWGEFFSDNPDLTGDRDLAELVVSQNQEEIKAIAQTRGKKRASEYIAQKVRARHQNWMDAQKPRRELTNSSAGASVGGAKSVTPKVGEEKASTFAEQLGTINKE